MDDALRAYGTFLVPILRDNIVRVGTLRVCFGSSKDAVGHKSLCLVTQKR